MAITKIIAVLAITVVAAEEDLSSSARRLAACDADPEKSCKCIMGCEVFGGDGGKCTDKKEDNQKLMAEKSAEIMKDKKKMCDNMMCQAYCAKNELDCIDDFKKTCEAYKKMDKDCGVDCAGANPTAILGMTALLVAAVMQI